MSEKIRGLCHDLSNKLAIIDGKSRKLKKILSDNDQALIELEKLSKATDASLEILEMLKKVSIEE